jgi:hypothetical protein
MNLDSNRVICKPLTHGIKKNKVCGKGRRHAFSSSLLTLRRPCGARSPTLSRGKNPLRQQLPVPIISDTTRSSQLSRVLPLPHKAETSVNNNKKGVKIERCGGMRGYFSSHTFQEFSILFFSDIQKKYRENTPTYPRTYFKTRPESPDSHSNHSKKNSRLFSAPKKSILFL